MAAAILYKTLAEVKVLHEFYLTDSTGANIFEINLQSDRLKFLEKRFSNDLPSINDDLSFDIPQSKRALLDGHHIRLLKTYSGYRLVVAVNEFIQSDGSRKYKPLFTFAEGLHLPVIVNKKNNNIDTFTNFRMRKSLPAGFYFTNDINAGPRTFPHLSHDLSAFSSILRYEQGELASYGNNDTREFYVDGVGAQWRKIKGSSFANENDRMLLPLQFTYTFDKAEPVLDVEFNLTDKDGNTIATIRKNENEPFVQAGLDFTSHIEASLLKQPSFYILEARVNNSYSRIHKLLFINDIDLLNNWAVINIMPFTEEAAYNLFDNDGFLKTRRTISGDIDGVPVFEIALKSRLTYWRYSHERKLKLKLSPKTQDLLDNINGVLISKSPRVSTSSPLFFTVPGSSLQHFLPCPSGNELVIEQDRFFSNITVTKSDIFPLAP